MMKQLKVSVGQFSDRGRKDINQDFHGLRIPQSPMITFKGVAAAMADGISSSDVSQIASELAVKTFLDDYYCTSETWTVKNSVERVLAAINTWLHTQTVNGPHRYDKDKGYVCTISALVIKNHTAHVFHVGDTRVYKLTTDGLEQLTNDHRLWATPDKSYLSRALGIDSQCSFDYQNTGVSVGDIFIITTDGIYESLSSNELIDIIRENEEHLEVAAKKIVSLAFEKESDDNLSIQLLRVDELADQANVDLQNQMENLPNPPPLTTRMDFDGYTIVRELHSNSRSHVYLAEDSATKKQVVIKALSTELNNDTKAQESFLMEEWIAKRVHSTHILKAYATDRERKYMYTVFEFIEGQTLAQWARDNPKPPIENVRTIIEQIAKGLNTFHRLQMLHQDLRPENIMIDNTGTVKIIDFGSVVIAGLQEAETEYPDTYLKGTALYSAPEYFLGEQGTTLSELFSLGVITYFLISGDYPYGANVAKCKTLAAQKRLWYKSLLGDDKEIPAWVDDAIKKAVNPVPHRRQEEIFEFIHDLRQPSQSFINKTKPPLIERNPVAVWQGISAILLAVIIYLLNR